ncbi:hypothetical protein GCM10014719_58020 [Planomonospora parontospora subsp. antibiotica]|nr:hypothetical protein GCM10014719_58020 [Planomonospora parontospora subsp. antibiotica]GII18941.1 hypothetical protein Ppa05_56670 [Planomonospora parontospora subsp. antibiotica]
MVDAVDPAVVGVTAVLPDDDVVGDAARPGDAGEATGSGRTRFRRGRRSLHRRGEHGRDEHGAASGLCRIVFLLVRRRMVAPHRFGRSRPGEGVAVPSAWALGRRVRACGCPRAASGLRLAMLTAGLADVDP